MRDSSDTDDKDNHIVDSMPTRTTSKHLHWCTRVTRVTLKRSIGSENTDRVDGELINLSESHDGQKWCMERRLEEVEENREKLSTNRPKGQETASLEMKHA